MSRADPYYFQRRKMILDIIPAIIKTYRSVFFKVCPSKKGG